MEKYEHRFGLWETVIFRLHRALMRLNGFNNVLGFRMGQTISEQFLGSAEHLDVTKAPEIACFFATHDGPAFAPVIPTNSSGGQPDLGVVYRFDVGSAEQTTGLEFDYYSAPPYFDAEAVVRSLEGASDAVDLWRPEEFMIEKIENDHRDWSRLVAPQGMVDQTRIGRQKAGFLVPDELRAESRTESGRQLVTFAAVEDLACRQGTERFFFNHGVAEADGIGLSPFDLWPPQSRGESLLVQLVGCVIRSWEIHDSWQAHQHLGMPEGILTLRGHTPVARTNRNWIPPRTDQIFFIN